MAQFQLKPNGELVLILSASEARGLSTCAREGYARIRSVDSAILGNQIQITATQRAIATLQMAVDKSRGS